MTSEDLPDLTHGRCQGCGALIHMRRGPGFNAPEDIECLCGAWFETIPTVDVGKLLYTERLKNKQFVALIQDQQRQIDALRSQLFLVMQCVG